MKEPPKFLSQKIIEAEKEAGITPFICKTEDCLHIRFEPRIAPGHYGRAHCREEIPYAKRINGELKLLGLCYHKIMEYWGK